MYEWLFLGSCSVSVRACPGGATIFRLPASRRRKRSPSGLSGREQRPIHSAHDSRQSRRKIEVAVQRKMAKVSAAAFSLLATNDVVCATDEGVFRLSNQILMPRLKSDRAAIPRCVGESLLPPGQAGRRAIRCPHALMIGSQPVVARAGTSRTSPTEAGILG